MNNFQQLINILGSTRVKEQELLGKYSSFKIGGPADLFVKATSTNELMNAIKNAYKLSVPIFILGAGTNLLISDNGFRGLVIKNETSTIKFVGMRGGKTNIGNHTNVKKVFLEVDSGVSTNRLVRFALDQGLKGLEAFLGQPGTIGGAVFINAHNMKKEKFFGENIVGARLLSLSGEEKKVDGKYFDFGYDSSILQKTGEIVLSIILALESSNKEDLWKEAQEVFNYRQASQPKGLYSSGCIFRNIKKSEAMRIVTPNFTTSTGFLLESVGLKGYKIGNAWFSDEHTNFIVHRGEAKAHDVLKLIMRAKKKIREKYRLELKEEIVLVGEF